MNNHRAQDIEMYWALRSTPPFNTLDQGMGFETCSRADKALDGANKCLHTSHLSQPMLWSHMKRTMRIVPLVKYLMEALATPSPQFWKVTRSMKQDLCGTSLFFARASRGFALS